MINRLTIRGFRGIAGEEDFDLGRITLLAGRNGLGKSTLFDAVDWCLFGSAWRLSDTPSAVQNLYQSRIAPYVSVALSLDDTTVTIERTADGASLDGQRVTDKELVTNFIRDVDFFPPYARDIADRVRRMVYLQQDNLRRLVSTDDPAERQSLLRALLGVPYAELVQSSIRRISDRISERRRHFQQSLANVDADLSAVQQEIARLRAATAPDRAPILAEARNVLGPESDGVDSTERLLAITTSQLNQARARRLALEDFNAFLTEASVRREALTRDLAQKQRQSGSVQSQLTARKGELADKTVRRRRIESRTATARDNLRAVTEQFDAATRIAARLRQLDSLHNALAQATEAARSAEDTVAAARADLAALDAELSQRQQLLDQQRATAADLLNREGTLRNQFDTIERRVELNTLLRDTEHALAALRTAKPLLEEELRDAQARHDALTKGYEVTTAALSSVERLRGLLSEATTVLRALDLTSCPLCGAAYTSKRELLAHIDTSLSRLHPQPAATAGLLKELTDARNVALAKARELQRVDAEISALEETLASTALDLGSLPPPPAAPDTRSLEEIAAARRAAEARIRESETTVVDVQRRVARARNALGSAELQLYRKHEELTAVETQIQLLADDLPAEARNSTAATAEIPAHQAQENHTAAASELTGLEDEERDVIADEQACLAETNQLQTQLDGLRAELAGDSQRTISLERQIQERTADVLGGPVQDVADRLADDLSAASIRETQLRTLTSRLETLISGETYEALIRQGSELRTIRSRSARDLESLSRAHDRFAEIAGAVEERAEIESRFGAEQLKNAIQECLQTLYPHRHLDRVELSMPEAEILLADRYLPTPVRPGLFYSTGQLNVLALAVFIAATLRQRVSKLGFILLDEPVQNLDDLHFLAFISLLKRVAISRQVILSTADNNIAELLRRQMKGSVWIDGFTYAHYEWRSFDPKTGPDVVRVESGEVRRRHRASA